MEIMEQIRLMTLDMQRWKEEKYGRQQLTEQQFLDRYKTCDKCARQAVCRKKQFGYYEESGRYICTQQQRRIHRHRPTDNRTVGAVAYIPGFCRSSCSRKEIAGGGKA